MQRDICIEWAERRQQGQIGMEAYWFAPKDGSITEAKTNRRPLDHEDYANFIDEGGSTRPIPSAMLGYYPSVAVGRPQREPPTSWIVAGGYCISRDAKQVIEELEPNLHQFIPLLLKLGTEASPRDYPYFSLHINQRVDDVLVEKSDVRWNTTEFKGKVIRSWLKKDAPLVLPAASIAGKHLWWNKKAHISLMSGTLHDRLTERGLTSGLKFQKQIVE